MRGRTSSSDENSSPSSSTKIRLSWMPSTDCRGDHVDAMTLIAHIVLDPGLLQPTHYHFRAGDIHHFHDTVEIKGRSLNQFSDNQKHTGRIPVVSLLFDRPCAYTQPFS